MIRIQHGYEAAAMAHDALYAVFEADTAQARLSGKTILIKPNIGRVSIPGTGVCTDPEVVRGAIRAVRALNPKRIIVGDGPIWGVDIWEALEQTGIKAVCEAENVECADLDSFGFVDLPIPSAIVVEKLRFSKIIHDVDCIISVPVMKTHMYTGVSLSIKNMKGCLYKMEKTKLHRINRPVPDAEKGRVLDYGIADMARVLLPHYALIDGTIGMEGLGPSVGTPRPVGVVLASNNALAADFAAVQLMGMKAESVPHLNLIREQQQPALNPAHLAASLSIEPADFLRHAVPFERASLQKLSNEYPNLRILEQGTCSACSAALMVFVRTHGKRFPNDTLALGTGKDLHGDDFLHKPLPDEAFYCIGNCAAGAAKELGIDYCKGCPPVGSSILAHIQGTDEPDE